MKKTIFQIATCVLSLCLLAACGKDDDGGGSSEKAKVFVTDSDGKPVAVEIDLDNFPATYSFTLSLDRPSDANLICDIVADESLVAAYNQAHGTDYKTLPESTYEISPMAIIVAGKTESYEVNVKFKSLYGTTRGVYLLPVAAVPDNAGAFDTADNSNVNYYLLDIEQELDYIVGLDMSTYNTSMYTTLNLPDNEVVPMGDNTHTFEMLIYAYGWRATTNYIGTWRGKDTGNNNENFGGCEIRIGNASGASNIGNRQADLTLTNQNRIVPSGEWVLVTVTCDGAETGQRTNVAYRLYFNGELIASAAPSKRYGPSSSQGFKVGYTFTGMQFGNTSSSQYFNGIISEVRMWKDCLTQEQIQANLRTVSNPSADKMLAYWKMSEGSGNTLNDSSGNNRHLTFPATATIKWAAELTTFD